MLSIYPVCDSSFSQQDFNYCPSINKPPFHKNGTEAGDILKQAGGLQHLAENQDIAKILLDVINTPISPELTPANEQGKIEQKTEDIVGPYELHDFFLYYVLRYGYRPSKILFLAQSAFAGRYTDEVIKEKMKIFFKRFFNNQFKRSCFPDGPKTSVVSLSPRGDWRMPSDAMATNWLAELENL